MITVSDAGPIQYLFRIDAIGILPALFGQVIVPEVIVAKEMAHDSTPGELKDWLAVRPPWFVVQGGAILVPESLAGLGLGEQHAIALALRHADGLLLCDDSAARKRAVHLGVSVIGTLGLLDEAGVRGLVDFDVAVDRLSTATNFRHSKPLLERIRAQHLRRMKSRLEREGAGEGP